MNKKSLLLAAVAAVSLLVGSAVAQTPPSPADSAVVYRKSMYQVMFNNWVKVLLMSSGKIPFDAKAAQLRASRANYLAKMISEGFGPESADGKPTGMLDKITPAVNASRDACKACHDKFRNE
jgi:cytochrome c556